MLQKIIHSQSLINLFLLKQIKKITKYNLSTATTINTFANTYGAFTRSNKKCIYIAQPKKTVLKFIDEKLPTISTDTQAFIDAGCTTLALSGDLYTHTYQVCSNDLLAEEAQFARTSSEKIRIKDHLGNVSGCIHIKHA